MILFCEECGTRHDIDENRIKGEVYRFSCNGCGETLMVSLANKQEGKRVQAALTHQIQPAASPEKILKILVVDDSKLIRKVLREIIESDGRKQVVGEAENGKQALEFLVGAQPDVITLDINMPVMDGITTLKHIMISRPVPTVMISALTKEGSMETFESLKYGAIDFLPKPSKVKGADLQSQKTEILRKIELASGVQIESIRYLRRPSQKKANDIGGSTPYTCCVAIGVAEGGYGALLNVIPRIKEDLPGAYVAVMHQPAHHIDGFSRYLDQCSQLSVQRAVDGTRLQGGTCYLSAATEQVTLVQEGGQNRLKVNSSSVPAPIGAIDILMGSVAEVMRERAAGVLLTGAGDDGVNGLGRVLQMGGTILVQDPRSCLFKEAPMKAVHKYSVEYLLSDKQMAFAINAFIRAHSN
ncbi:MAG: response regulator [Desulfobacteraceae bacterium]|nr:MAG: response regulator [Desulfobacteraceae bacterium]